MARIAWEARRDEAQAIQLLEVVLKARAYASPTEVVRLETLLGDIHLERSRISHAESAFGEALKLDPKAAEALRGLGDAMYRAGRYSEALARFEAGTKANPDDLNAKVGVAKTLLGLERLQDAKAMLDKLRASYPQSMEVAYWYGRMADALGLRDQAEEAFRRAIEVGGRNQRTVEAYIALGLLYNQRGLSDLAQQTLALARSKLGETPSVHKALGELAITQGRHTDAIQELRAALKLDPGDIGARYRLGVALRRNREFEAAAEAFDQVGEVDRDYPGLSLERGLLYESSGRSEEALKAYEAALAKAPDDLDLMLRVGCSKVAAGRPDQAEELLRKVLTQRGNSAETNHCYGRALLLRGRDVMQALKRLEQAVELAPNRAEYHLYMGWAALEAGRIAEAEKALKRALELDQGLGDAYWQRGVLRYRQGAVQDAVVDLKRALELNPSRYEAHAALADSYYDLGKEAESLAEWEKAVTADPDNATWLFRYGRLLAANHKDEQALTQLKMAIELAEKSPPLPRWIWEAHLLLARALDTHPEAVKHWRAFLGTGPLDSPYRSEAIQALRRAGQPYEGN
jgi:tetratricopeptide (TPR) repeat protein